MKKKSIFIVLAICTLIAVLLTGCNLFGSSDDGGEQEYKLIFVGTSLPSMTIKEGVITLPTPTSEGYDFGGWFVDSACIKPFNNQYINEHPITEDLRLYPKWIAKGSNDVTISLDVNGGNELVDDEIVIVKGMNVAQQLPIPTKGGCAFVGWYDALEEGNQMTDASGQIANYTGEDATFYARWEITTYDINVSSFDDNIGTVSGGKQNAEYLEEITVVATTIDDNYDFLGWYVDGELVADTLEYEFPAEEDLDLVAKWIGEERVVKFYRNYMLGDDSYVDYVFNYGSSVTYTPSRRAGYSFIGWYDNPECVGDPVCINGNFDKMTYANNTILYAGWSEGHDQLTFAQIGHTDAVKVVGIKEGAGAIIHIPTVWSGFNVTTIGSGVFENSNKNAIVISSSITTIEENAFNGATANIYFDKGADLSLLHNTNFTSAQNIYTHLTLDADNALADGEYVEANGILADTVINSVEEARSFYSYCWLYTYTERFTLKITSDVYSGNNEGFENAMLGEDGVFKNVNLELSLKSETASSYSYSINEIDREISFTFSKKTGNAIASEQTAGGKKQVQSKGLIDIKNVGNAHEFIIDSMPEFVVYNSEQLVYAVEHGYQPIFGVSGTTAEDCYNKARTALTNIINDEMTEIEKIKVIHDYIALTVTYDSELLLISTQEGVDPFDISHYRGFYIEGVFEDGKAVCDGITKAFMLMCRIEGIEAIRVSGKSRSWNAELGKYVEVGHAWNKVHVDGKWYTIDTTNDDSILSIGGIDTDYEVLNHQFFMVSDASIASSHVEDTYKDIPVSEYTYDYYSNTTYDGERDLVITSQVELDTIVLTLKALINSNDNFYTIDVKVQGVNAESLDFGKELGGYSLIPRYQINNGIYLVNFITKD